MAFSLVPHVFGFINRSEKRCGRARKLELYKLEHIEARGDESYGLFVLVVRIGLKIHFHSGNCLAEAN